MDPALVDILKIAAGVAGGSLIKPGWDFGKRLLGYRLRKRELDANIGEQWREARQDDVDSILEKNLRWGHEMQKDAARAKQEARKVYEEYIQARTDLMLSQARAVELEIRNSALLERVANLEKEKDDARSRD